jgi:hypothetical protein
VSCCYKALRKRLIQNNFQYCSVEVCLISQVITGWGSGGGTGESPLRAAVLETLQRVADGDEGVLRA